MIEYSLKLKNGDLYPLTGTDMAGKSLTFGTDDISWDSETLQFDNVEKLTQIGDATASPRSLSFTYTRDASNFRVKENQIIRALNACAYVVDVTNQRSIGVIPNSYSVQYPDGSHKIMGRVTFTLKLKAPYWESLDIIEEDPEVVPADIPNDIDYDIAGYADIMPVLEITASDACDSLVLTCPETGDTLALNNAVFGTFLNETLVIDNENGTAFIGSTNVRNDIQPGTSFMRFPSGAATLSVTASAEVSIVLSYRKKEYI